MLAHYLIATMIRVLAPRVALEPCPGWHLGSGESGSGVGLRARRRLWLNVKETYAIGWVGGLRVLLLPGNETSRAVFLTGRYEPNEFFWLSKVLKRGMTFLDVGANIGLYTLLAARQVGSEGVVVAIEPSQREFRILKAHIDLNHLTNVRLLPVAASNRDGEAELLVAADEMAGHNTLGAFGYDSVTLKAKERVRLGRLDRLVESLDLQRVDVIKLDVEGAELFALQGAEGLLRRFHPSILIELSDRTLSNQGCHSGQVWDLLCEIGYRIYRLDDNAEPSPLAERPAYLDAENLIAVYRGAEDRGL